MKILTYNSAQQAYDSSSSEDLDIKPAPVRTTFFMRCNEACKENVEGVLAASDLSLIGQEIHAMNQTLQAIRRSVRAKERKLNRAIEGNHPEVTIVERAMSPIYLTPRPPPRKRGDDAKKELNTCGEFVNQCHLKFFFVETGANRANQDATDDEPEPDERKFNMNIVTRHHSDVRQLTEGEPLGHEAIDPHLDGSQARSETTQAKAPRRKAVSKIKSKEFVDEEDMDGEPTAPQQPEEPAIADKAAPTTVEPPKHPNTVVVATAKKAASKPGDANKKGSSTKTVEEGFFQLCVNKHSFFHKPKLDLNKILKDVTDDEARRILVFEDQLPTGQIKWGETLSYPIRNILHEWAYDELTEGEHAQPRDLRQFTFLMKDMSDDDKMITRLKSAPCLLQLHEKDPFYTAENIDWRIIQSATEYPWKHRNAILRGIHGMTCRTNDSDKWSKDPDLNKELAIGFRGLQVCLQESLESIAEFTDHADLKIKIDGEDSVIEEFVEMSKSMAYVFSQITIKARPEEDPKKKNSRTPPHGLSWLIRKYYLALAGVLMVYEAQRYDMKMIDAEKSGMKGDDLKELKDKLKDGTCIKQFVRENLRIKKLAIKASEEQGAIEGDAKHAQSMQEGALLIHLTSLLCTRRRDRVDEEYWGYGRRAWNRMDNHMFKTLRKFMTDDGDFVEDIDWPTMTATFQEEFSTVKIAHLLVLDMQCEICLPGLSRSLTGGVAPPPKDKDRPRQLLRPDQVKFRRMFGPTEGAIHPVSNRGVGLHPEKQVSQENPSTSTFTPQNAGKSGQSSKNPTGQKRVASVIGGKGKKRKVINAVSEYAREEGAANRPSQPNTQASQPNSQGNQ
ncbi:hypothetical protein DFH28DRAFT_916912 [Melampsora americana]|nr:hypothetical protein DFH28DRAFT_916912 [Melampsora americana]